MFSSCIGLFSTSSSSAEKEPLTGRARNKPCPFCHIPPADDTTSTFKIVLQSEDFIAFHDRSPRAKVHLLTVPRKHIGSVRDLKGAEGASLGEQCPEYSRTKIKTTMLTFLCAV